MDGDKGLVISGCACIPVCMMHAVSGLLTEYGADGKHDKRHFGSRAGRGQYEYRNLDPSSQ